MPDDGLLEQSFAVTYDPSCNRHLAGRGRLTVCADAAIGGRLYVFTGRTRRLFSRAEATLTLTANRIRNVELRGTRVRFTADFIEKTGLRPQVFAFEADREEDAAAIAALLPATVDATLLAEREFTDRLSRLPHSRHPWTSLTGLIVLANIVVFLAMAGFFDVDRSTAHRRDALQRFTEARAEGGRHLLAALRDGDSEALKSYEAAESEATDALHSLRSDR
ncbi:MAG TPA: hypothetical protein VGD81_19970 [Opitutaceae bacterium]